MKRNKFWHYLFFFLLGALFCYTTLQFAFFEFDMTINVIETLISVTTLVVGFIIAINIQRKLNQGQNHYSFILNKFQIFWDNYISFSNTLSENQSIPLTKLNKTVKDYYRRIAHLKQVFTACQHPITILDEIENKIDDLEELLNAHVSNNIVNLVINKAQVIGQSNEIGEEFARLYRQISTL